MNFDICGDCFCKEGELHEEGCDMEKCPNCGGQLISCGCFMDNRVYDNMKNIPNREPFFVTTDSCARCGVEEPRMMMVDNETWKNICGVTFNEESILCPACMDFIIEKRKLNPKERRYLG